MGLMEKAPRSASVRCISSVGLLKISREDFQALTGSYSNLRDQLEERVGKIKTENENAVGDITKKLNQFSDNPEKEPEETTEKQNNDIYDTDIDIPEDEENAPPQFKKTFEESLKEKTFSSIQNMEKDLEQKLYKSPSNFRLLKKYAELQNYMGYLENALTIYHQYMELKPNEVPIMTRVGDIYRRLERYDDCIKILKKPIN